MAKKIRVGNAMLCEYVTRGSLNKHILVNAYSGNVVFKALPREFGFGLYIEVLGEQEFSALAMSIRLSGTEIASLSAEPPDTEGFGTLIVPMIQTRIEAPTTLEVYLSAPRYATTLALSKRLYVAPGPDASTRQNASPLPSSRRGASPRKGA